MSRICRLFPLIIILSGIFLITELNGPVWGNGDFFKSSGSSSSIKRLEQLIEAQQSQLEAQARAIEDLKMQLQRLKDEAATDVKPLADNELVKSQNDKMSVKLYGQVNRGLLLVNDGSDSYLLHVDNDNSSTRIGLLGTAKLNDDLTAGAKIEVQFESNSTADVNQVDQRGQSADHFTQRHLDLFFDSKSFGKVSIGQGDTASNGTSEMDLSGTGVAGYSGVADMASGLFFYDSGVDALSDTRVGDVFTNMDGLSRDDRLRYDTPSLYGFKVSASAVAGEAYDVALSYSGDFGGTKLVAAVAYADPETAREGTEYQVNGSISALHSSGFNITLAAGSRNFELADRDDATFFYGKVGYKADLFAVGGTSLALDYSQSNDVSLENDEADTIGAMLVQNIDALSTEYYFIYRRYQLDRPGFDFDEIDAVLTGFRVKF